MKLALFIGGVITNEGGTARADNYNEYHAISFGGNATDDGGMKIQLVAVQSGIVPGIYVEFTGSLASNGGFLETQIANDLKDIAYIDRAAEDIPDTLTARTGATTTALEKRLPVATEADATQLNDGKFIIYFNDFGSDEVVVVD